MGKKPKFKKFKKKRLKTMIKPNSNRIKNNNSQSEKKSELMVNKQNKKNKSLLHKRKEYKRKIKKIKKKNKNLFKVDHELMDEIDDMLFNEEDIERLPHDKFETYPIPITPEENKEYIPLIISDSDIILELLDARDIIHSRNIEIEKLINNKNKILIYVLSKSDLVSADYLLKVKNYLLNENETNIIISISCLIRETIQSLIVELEKYVTNLRNNIDKNKIIKLGILGGPNVGKNSLIQSLELIVNSNCTEKYIFFGEDKTFSINSVPGVLFDEKEENNFLISKMNKNIKDIKEPKKLLENLINLVNGEKLKDIYELSTSPENLNEFIQLLKEKYQSNDENVIIWKILGDIINGKIKYEIDIDKY